MLQISQGISSVLTKIAFSTTRSATTTPFAVITKLNFHTSHVRECEKVTTPESADTEENSEIAKQQLAADIKREKNDRTKVIPVETAIRYLKSAADKQTYGDQLVWEQYRRNHKGLFAPRKTRKTCIRRGTISTGNPCPICRDEYLVLDYRNIELLRQFISEQSGQVLSYSKTGLCQKKHLELLVAVERAMDYGLITFDVPFRKYDYSEYYDKKKENSRSSAAESN